MRIITHTLFGLLALALVFPVASIILTVYGVNFLTVVLLMVLVAVTLVALHNIRVAVDDYLIYLSFKRRHKVLDTTDQKG